MPELQEQVLGLLLQFGRGECKGEKLCFKIEI